MFSEKQKPTINSVVVNQIPESAVSTGCKFAMRFIFGHFTQILWDLVETFIISLVDVVLCWLAISMWFIGKQEVKWEVSTTDGDSFLYERIMRQMWVGARISNWYFPCQGSCKLCASDNAISFLSNIHEDINSIQFKTSILFCGLTLFNIL